MAGRKYIVEYEIKNTETQAQDGGNIDPKGANMLLFKNLGDIPVTINGSLPMLQYDEHGTPAFPGEIDTTNYQYKFGDGSTAKLLIIRKYYL